MLPDCGTGRKARLQINMTVTMSVANDLHGSARLGCSAPSGLFVPYRSRANRCTFVPTSSVCEPCIYSYTVIYALDLHSKHVSMFLSAWKKDENMTKPLQPSDS